jgi:hypothetical protein
MQQELFIDNSNWLDMFRAIVLPIFRTIRLCDTACGIMHTICGQAVEELTKPVPPLPDHRPATYPVHYTTSCIAQSNAPEDGQNNCPKHVELIGIINKQLLLHLVGCLLYYLYQISSPNLQFISTAMEDRLLCVWVCVGVFVGVCGCVCVCGGVWVRVCVCVCGCGVCVWVWCVWVWCVCVWVWILENTQVKSEWKSASLHCHRSLNNFTKQKFRFITKANKCAES